MIFERIISRIISVAIGYIFGLFQTGYLYGKSKGIDIRTQGSGNAGTTNSLRVLGAKAGAITFIGDLLKAILAVLVVHFIFKDIDPEYAKLYELYAGFGAVLGHNFPFLLLTDVSPQKIFHTHFVPVQYKSGPYACLLYIPFHFDFYKYSSAISLFFLTIVSQNTL